MKKKYTASLCRLSHLTDSTWWPTGVWLLPMVSTPPELLWQYFSNSAVANCHLAMLQTAPLKSPRLLSGPVISAWRDRDWHMHTHHWLIVVVVTLVYIIVWETSLSCTRRPQSVTLHSAMSFYSLPCDGSGTEAALLATNVIDVESLQLCSG